MNIKRRFTEQGTDVWTTVKWAQRSTRIANTDGSVVFEMNDAWVPEQWTQLATDIMVSKYFRKAGVPQVDDGGTPLLDDDGNQQTGPERSARQVIHRLAGCWRAWGEAHDYFDTPEDAEAFYDEMCWMMLHQVGAPNSPQWFNTGLNWAYGITGPAQGHFVADAATGSVHQAQDAYSHPQPHACFIQSLEDDLVGEGGIMDLWTREARLFKYGSGTGTNFSSLRGENEPLSGGGKSSGLMSFLKIGDRAAGAIKSGGTTRRAAKMVCLDADHPDIEAFINWKVREELKVAAMVEGMSHLKDHHLDLAAKLGLELDYDFNGEAYQTVSGQNSNNSVRLSHDFFEAVKHDEEWTLRQRTDGEVAKTLKARGLWEQVCDAAWLCADPGVQFDTSINDWHTCPSSGRINASNPCSEYMFLDDTACNLASLNLLRFYDSEERIFDLDSYEHAIRLWTMVLEISVLMAAFPSEAIARKSWRYRTLGLGFANLGAMLMQAGVPYDSEEGRGICAALSSILTGRSYAVSAEMASQMGPFDGYEDNSKDMLRVMRNHRRAAHGEARDSSDWEKLRVAPVPIDHGLFLEGRINVENAGDMLGRAVQAWDEAVELGQAHGFRNAQVTVIAPTGTIGLLMDCDTTGVEPDFALTKFKKLAGGGYFKIANQSIRPSLAALGYDEDDIDRIVTYVMGTLTLDTPLPAGVIEDAASAATLRDWLADKGFVADDLAAIESSLSTVFELSFAFNAWTMPERILEAHGLSRDEATADSSFNGLAMLGLTRDDLESLNRIICGTQTIEGAPGLAEEHLSVFDCANRCGQIGTRFIAAEGHIRMMAACQPFITGAISKTINLPNESSVEDIGDCYWLSWELGLKANALYRDGCKLSQPLNAAADESALTEEEDDLDLAMARKEVTHEVVAAAEMIDTDDVSTTTVERVVEKIIERPMRRRLPDTRSSTTHHFNVAGHEGYLTVGMYDDGAPGELFITMSKEGSTIGGLMDSLGTAISVALQYGVPIDSLVNKFAHQRFEPQGVTTNRDIPFAKSLVDYIFRWLGMQFMEGYREANAPARPAAQPTAAVKEDTRWTEDAPEERIDTTRQDSSITAQDDGVSTAKTVEPGRVSRTMIEETIAVQSTRVMEDGSTLESESLALQTSLSQSTAVLQSDAPPCPGCGQITVRSGTCYKCLNCGESLGCS